MSHSGVINYAYKGKDPKLTLSKSEMNELRTTVNKVLNTFRKIVLKIIVLKQIYM